MHASGIIVRGVSHFFTRSIATSLASAMKPFTRALHGERRRERRLPHDHDGCRIQVEQLALVSLRRRHKTRDSELSLDFDSDTPLSI